MLLSVVVSPRCVGGVARRAAYGLPGCSAGPRRHLRTTRIHRRENDAATLTPVRPTIKGKPYYVTTPIFYVNARPHIGHLQSMVMADVLARWHQWRHRGWAPPQIVGNDEGTPSYDDDVQSFAVHDADSLAYKDVDHETSVVFATGTDEHGGKIQKEAEKLNTTPRELCDRVSQSFKQLADAAGVQYTRFIRTTDDDHKQTVTSLWTRLVDDGFIYKDKHSGWYSVSDEAFYPESQVCASPQGDGQMVSSETGSAVEWMEEENYKFRLQMFEEPLREWLKANPAQIVPQSRYNDTLKELQDGLSDLSVSRPSSRLQWGIGVPGDGEQTMYVWFDALLNYVTVSGYPWKANGDGAATTPMGSWPADAQLVGKDIIRFHAIYFPAFLMALRLPLPRQLITHGHWKVGQSKMSKSRGNSVDPFDALQLIGRDELRMYLIRTGGNLGRDADWSEATVVEYRRKYVQGLWGNLMSRVLTQKLWLRLFAHMKPRVTLPNPLRLNYKRSREFRDADTKLYDMTVALPSKVDRHMARSELDLAMRAITEVLEQCHQHWSFTEPFQPSNATGLDKVAEAHVRESNLWMGVFLSLEALRIAALLAQPVMPEKTKMLLDAIDIPLSDRTFLHAQTYRSVVKKTRPDKKAAILIQPLSTAVEK